MAFNFQTFKTRTLTAIIFAAVMLSGLLINQWTFFILFSIIHFGCWIEYQKLVGLIDPDYKNISPFHKYAVMLLGWMFMFWMTNHAYKIGTVELQGIGWLMMLIIAILLLGKEVVFKKQLNIKLIGYSLLGLIYISLSWGLMMSIRNIGMVFKGPALLDFGMIFPLAIIVSIWINDTMAYIVGSFIGKTPLSKISPKKTWEGTIGGIILSVAVVGSLAYQMNSNSHERMIYLIIALIASVFGTLGDLLESKLKRMANVKDSGSIMPGHGGFLDRFDSLLIATPMVWLFLKFFL